MTLILTLKLPPAFHEVVQNTPFFCQKAAQTAEEFGLISVKIVPIFDIPIIGEFLLRVLRQLLDFPLALVDEIRILRFIDSTVSTSWTFDRSSLRAVASRFITCFWDTKANVLGPSAINVPECPYWKRSARTAGRALWDPPFRGNRAFVPTALRRRSRKRRILPRRLPTAREAPNPRGRAGDRGKGGFHPSSQCQLFRFASFFVVVVHNHHNHNLLLLLLLLRFVCFVGEVGNATNRWEKESNCLELGRRD